ncbi:MAG: hypothetical protein HQK61_05105 [Desulfamplus sp.]|nr:hypothetical protein [Desulfamplus sp.]
MVSTFISGLINEESESLSSQLGLWHHLTLRNILQRKFTGWLADSDHLGDFLQERSRTAAMRDTVELRAWKLNEVMLFLRIPVPEKLDIYSLNAVGTEIEVQATALLRKVDKEFCGVSPDDMVRYLLIKIINNFSEQFKEKDNKTQDKIIKNILDILHSMPEDKQDILKGLLSVKEFSTDMIRKAIFDHTLTTALASFMMMVRYTIYYEISKVAIVLSGAVSLYIAKPYLKSFIPLFIFLFSPVAVASIGVGLTWWTDVYTNRQIRSFLLPVMVMSSILASAKADIESARIDIEFPDDSISNFIDHYNHRYLKPA